MDDTRIVVRPTELQAGIVGLPGIAIDSSDPTNTNPPRITNDGQELQVEAQRADLDTPLASAEVAHLGVILRPRIAISSNVTTLEGLGTYQSVALADGNLIVLWGQTDPKENGPYIVHTNIAGVAQDWTRPALPFGHGSLSYVLAGTYAGQVLLNTNTSKIVYGTSNITFSQILNGTDITATKFSAGEFDILGATTPAFAASVAKLFGVDYNALGSRGIGILNSVGSSLLLRMLAASATGGAAIDVAPISLANGATYDYENGSRGGFAIVASPTASGSTWGVCSFAQDGTTSVNGLAFTDFAVADTGAKLCAFGLGGKLRLKNNLGTTRDVLLIVFLHRAN